MSFLNFYEIHNQNAKKYKQTLLRELEKEDAAVLGLAYQYAYNMYEYGVDVTKAWTTVVENTANLDKAYQKGYYEGLTAAKAWDKVKENISKTCADEKKEPQNPIYKFEIGQIVGKVNGYPNPLTFKVLDRFVVNLIHPYYKIGLIDRFFDKDIQETVPNHYEYVPEDRLKLPDEGNAHISTFKFNVGDTVKFKGNDHGLFKVAARYWYSNVKSNAYKIGRASDGCWTVVDEDQLELVSKR